MMLNKNTVFCFTGKSPQSRSKMEAMAMEAGASITKSITSRTTILVLADIHSQSSKAKKARINGVSLITPEIFFIMCKGKKLEPKKETVKNPQKINVVPNKPRRRIVLD